MRGKIIEHTFVNGIEGKVCSKCGEWKTLSEFSKYSKNSDGLQSDCKECNAKHNAEYKSTIVGTAIGRWHSYIIEDRKYKRIGDEIPDDYVTLSDVLRIMTKRCKHCGKVGWRKVGLNRLDDFLPHIKSNVEPCCQSCNKKKPRPTRKRNTELKKNGKPLITSNFPKIVMEVN